MARILEFLIYVILFPTLLGMGFFGLIYLLLLPFAN